MDSATAVADPITIDHVVLQFRPFHQATDGRPFPSAASYAVRRVIPSESTTTVTSRPKEVMANQFGPKSSTPSYVPQMAREYVSTLTSWVPVVAPLQNASAPMYAPSAVPKITMPSHGYVDLDPTQSNPFLSMTSPSLLHYRNFYDTIIHRNPLSTNTDSHNGIYNHIIQPYNANTFESLLVNFSIN